MARQRRSTRPNRALLASATALVALMLGWPAAPARAQVVPDLTGETLQAAVLLPGTTLEVSGTCDPDGMSTFSFTASGLAEGPYPGTFTESGTFTMGPLVIDPFGLVNQQPLDFSATFTIFSGPTLITGTKSFAPEVALVSQNALCGAPVPTLVDIKHFQSGARYTAQIDTPAGVFSDSGTSPILEVSESTTVANVHASRFFEDFVSDSPAPVCEDDDDDQGEDEDEDEELESEAEHEHQAKDSDEDDDCDDD